MYPESSQLRLIPTAPPWVRSLTAVAMLAAAIYFVLQIPNMFSWSANPEGLRTSAAYLGLAAPLIIIWLVGQRFSDVGLLGAALLWHAVETWFAFSPGLYPQISGLPFVARGLLFQAFVLAFWRVPHAQGTFLAIHGFALAIIATTSANVPELSSILDIKAAGVILRSWITSLDAIILVAAAIFGLLTMHRRRDGRRLRTEIVIVASVLLAAMELRDTFFATTLIPSPLPVSSVVRGTVLLVFVVLVWVDLAVHQNRMWRSELERSRLATRAARAEGYARLGETAAMLVHDIRKPFAQVQGLLALLEGRIESNATLKKATAQLQRSLVDSEKFLHGVMDLARAEPLNPQLITVGQLVLDAMHFAFGPKTKHQHLKYALLAEHLILVDPVQLRRAFGNVLANAADVPEANNTITIRSEDVEEAVLITVHNTGSRLPDDAHEKMFTPGFSRRPGGTGLGLAITRRLVEECGGSITAANAPDGVVFRLQLPAASERELRAIPNLGFELPASTRELIHASSINTGHNVKESL